MTPLAAALALVVGLSPPAAVRPGDGLPVSGFRGTGGAVTAPGGGKAARGGKRPSRLRADSFVAGMPAADGPTLRRVPRPFVFDQKTQFPDTLDVIFFANTRPIRVRVHVSVNGEPLAAVWEAHLRRLFAAFDRDGDGVINRFESDHIFSAKGVSSMLFGSHYYRTPTSTPAFEDLDRDADGRVSYAEFAAYYAAAAADLVRPRAVSVDAPNAGGLTHELFALLDANKDGKLTREEVSQAEKILVTNDRDDDECLSPGEIFPDLNEPARRRVAAETTAVPTLPKQPASPDLLVFGGPLPGTVTQSLIKRYDKNGDYHLTREEVGFDPAAFASLDSNKDGKLSAAEIEAWRTGPPEFTVGLNLGKTAKECTAAVTPVGRATFPPDVERRPAESGRVVLRVGKQFLDLSVAPPQTAGQQNRDAQQFISSFPQGKAFVTEDEIGGPQYQFLRIVFDSADFNGDGKLTREEFKKYLDLQQSTIDLALTLTHATRTPSLFQLMDENGDGRLGVRELRTAFDRLIVLEPGGGGVVTKAAIQPSAGVRLGRSAFVGMDPSGNGNPFQRQSAGNSRGPLWFRKMDRNGDGDVSRAEFLGAPEDFTAIDANGDGLISVEEAEAFDKKVRKPAGEKAKK